MDAAKIRYQQAQDKLEEARTETEGRRKAETEAKQALADAKADLEEKQADLTDAKRAYSGAIAKLAAVQAAYDDAVRDRDNTPGGSTGGSGNQTQTPGGSTGGSGNQTQTPAHPKQQDGVLAVITPENCPGHSFDEWTITAAPSALSEG